MSKIEGPRRCGVSPRHGATSAGLQIRQRPDRSRSASFWGVQRCGSQHACPSCAAAVGGEMTADLQRAVRHVIDAGGSVLHMTMTVRHERTDSLTESWDALQDGFRHVTTSRDWADLREFGADIGTQCAVVRSAFGRRTIPRKVDRDDEVRRLRAKHDGTAGLWTYARAVESTWGQGNGWHPHLHVLLFFREKVGPQTAKLMHQMIYRRYLDGLEKNGYTASAEIGVKVEIATTRRKADQVLGAYLNKIALEIGRPDLKRAKMRLLGENGEATRQREERWTPFGLLAAVASGERPELLRVWHEWEIGSKGRQRVTFGTGWKELLDAAGPAPEQADVPAQLADAEAPSDRVGWPIADHGIVLRHRRRLLRLGEREGWVPVLELLTELNIRWRWVLRVDDIEAPDDECIEGEGWGLSADERARRAKERAAAERAEESDEEAIARYRAGRS